MINLKSLFIDPSFLISIDSFKSVMDRRELGVIIDLRSIEEYNKGHLQSSINIPLSELKFKIGSLVPVKTTRIFCYSKDGKEGYDAVKQLRNEGYQLSFSIDKGFDGWVKKGFEVVNS